VRYFLFLAALIISVAHSGPSVGWSADDPQSSHPKPDSAQPKTKCVPPAKAAVPPLAFSPEVEAEAMALVRPNLLELAQVLEPLKTANPPEYRKAITELAAEARTLTALRARNPARSDLALEAWKARTRVELIAAQLAGAPSPEGESRLRAAIEARVDVEIRRHRFEVGQQEAAIVKVRENLKRVEANRDRAKVALDRAEKDRNARVEARFRALLPKKVSPTATKPVPRSSMFTIPTPTPTPTPSDDAETMPSLKAPIEGETR